MNIRSAIAMVGLLVSLPFTVFAQSTDSRYCITPGDECRTYLSSHYDKHLATVPDNAGTVLAKSTMSRKAGRHG